MEGAMRLGDGRNRDSPIPATTIRITTGQPSRAKSSRVLKVECQSPATARPKIRPAAERKPALLTPEARSRSRETEEEIRQPESTMSQLAASAPTPREAEKTFSQSDEPAPIFPPTYAAEKPSNAPLQAIAAAGLFPSRASVRR